MGIIYAKERERASERAREGGREGRGTGDGEGGGGEVAFPVLREPWNLLKHL